MHNSLKRAESILTYMITCAFASFVMVGLAHYFLCAPKAPASFQLNSVRL